MIQEDELGPWLDLGHGAIRPAGPTRFKLGQEVDENHFGGSTLHGVGKVAGVRGGYQEAWLSAPKPRELHDEDRVARPASHRIDFDFARDDYLRDMAGFKRGNPGFDPTAEFQSMMHLKAGRERYMASVGYTYGMIKIESELLAEGSALGGAIRTRWEADKLDAEAAAPSAPAKGGLRM